MKHIVFEQSDNYPVALLIKSTAFIKSELESSYANVLDRGGVPKADQAYFTLSYDEKGKSPVKLINKCLGNLLPTLKSIGTNLIYCADAAYFKKLTGLKKAEPHLGYALPCVIKDYEDFIIVLGVNHRSLIYNDNNQSKLDLSIETLISASKGEATRFDKSFLISPQFPSTVDEIKSALVMLSALPTLTVDVETFSLDFEKAGIATIAFGTSKSTGISFSVDYKPLAEPIDGVYGVNCPNLPVRSLLKEFFDAYQGTLIFHNAAFDIKVLIYELYMGDLLDNAGLLEGLHTLTRNYEDTKLTAYLTQNTTSQLSLSLKTQAFEYAGNYAQEDIHDVTLIPLPELLEYNLIDSCSTFYIFLRDYPKLATDQQIELYNNLFLPNQKVITQAELTGMPLCKKRVQQVKNELQIIRSTYLATIMNMDQLFQTVELLTTDAYLKDYRDRVSKAKNREKIKYKVRDEFPDTVFNPNSSTHLIKLFYVVMDLPVLERTNGGQPSTGADVISKLIHHTDDLAFKEVLEAFIEYSKVHKILTTFITAFEKAIDKGDGVVYLHGSFNLGGTVSGRLSSSNPNLQNIPAGSKYGKLVKSCFVPPNGWLFAGADSNSLEDYVSALTTKDPNKLKVYEEGYDGHCLRAYSYFGNQMPDIVDTVDSVNSIKKKYPELRQESKAPTFALTYQGTAYTLMKNCGFDRKKAESVEAKYHEMYSVSDQWVQDRLLQAETDGYVTGAFGLRLRTPLLAKCIRGNSSTPKEAEAEGRTVGNMLGQSYCMLTSRAANEFMQRVWNSPHLHSIKPIAFIHDAIYLLIKNEIEVVHWVNEHLIQCMEWQELPELKHDTVKLGAELDIHYQNWSQPITIPNKATKQEIIDISFTKMSEYDGLEQAA